MSHQTARHVSSLTGLSNLNELTASVGTNPRLLLLQKWLHLVIHYPASKLCDGKPSSTAMKHTMAIGTNNCQLRESRFPGAVYR